MKYHLDVGALPRLATKSVCYSTGLTLQAQLRSGHCPIFWIGARILLRYNARGVGSVTQDEQEEKNSPTLNEVGEIPARPRDSCVSNASPWSSLMQLLCSDQIRGGGKCSMFHSRIKTDCFWHKMTKSNWIKALSWNLPSGVIQKT